MKYFIYYLLTLSVLYFFDLINFEFLEPAILHFLSGFAIGEMKGISIFYFIAYYGLADFYIKLYSFCYWIPWYEIVYFLLFGLGITTLFVSLKTKLFNLSPFILALFYLVVFVLTFTLLLPLQYTKLSFVLCISGIVFFINSKFNYKQFGWCFFLFLIGALIRIEIGIMIVVLFSFTILFVKKITKIQLFYFFSTLFLILFISFKVSHEIKNSDDYLKKLEPTLVYQLIDRKNIKDIGEMNGNIEKTKYQTFQNLISDPEVITLKFLNSLIKDSEYYGIKKQYFERANDLILVSIQLSIGSVLIFFFLTVIIGINMNSSRNLLKFFMINIGFNPLCI